MLIGADFGYIVGLTSVGSGTFFGLVMVMIYPLTTELRLPLTVLW